LQTLTLMQKEGKLEAIGIPPEWADYKDILCGLYQELWIEYRYQAEAEFSSAQELEVFKNSKPASTCDIGDVGFKFGPQAQKQGFVTPINTRNWDDIDA